MSTPKQRLRRKVSETTCAICGKPWVSNEPDTHLRCERVRTHIMFTTQLIDATGYLYHLGLSEEARQSILSTIEHVMDTVTKMVAGDSAILP